jgi:hypothetical protein
VTVAVVENIPDLTDVEQDAFRVLTARWLEKLNRNILRARYYDHKETLRNVGISIPPQLRLVEHVIGWPQKGVDTLGRRISLDGFVLPGVDLNNTAPRVRVRGRDGGRRRVWRAVGPGVVP